MCNVIKEDTSSRATIPLALASESSVESARTPRRGTTHHRMPTQGDWRYTSQICLHHRQQSNFCTSHSHRLKSWYLTMPQTYHRGIHSRGLEFVMSGHHPTTQRPMDWWIGEFIHFKKSLIASCWGTGPPHIVRLCPHHQSC